MSRSCTHGGVPWRRKSSYSTGGGGECVEVAAVPGAVLVRDSKQRDGEQLAIGAAAWTGFVALAAGC
ncbi:DUF397 domain-containing protein [Streptomyces populi]